MDQRPENSADVGEKAGSSSKPQTLFPQITLKCDLIILSKERLTTSDLIILVLDFSSLKPSQERLTCTHHDKNKA